MGIGRWVRGRKSARQRRLKSTSRPCSSISHVRSLYAVACLLTHPAVTCADDVVNATVASLLALSRMNKRPAFGAIFLLNNISYLRTHLIVRPRTDIPSILSRPSQELLNSNFRTAKAGYFDANFSPLLQTLIDEKDKGKSAVKEKFNRFFELLDEVTERHQMARVLADDPEGRAQVADEAVKLVVPSLQRFIQRNLGKEFSKSASRCDLSLMLCS